MLKRLLIIIIICALCALVVHSEDKEEELTSRIKELIKQLGNDDWQERESAQKALEEIGEPAEEALTDAAKSSDPEIRHRASIIIKPLVVKKRVKFSEALLKEFPNIYRELATSNSMDKFKLLQKVTAPREQNRFNYKYKITNQDIAGLIGEVLLEEGQLLDFKAKEDVIRIVTYPNPIPEAAPHMMKLLRDKNNIIRSTTASALGRFGAKEAIPELMKLLNDTEEDVCTSSIKALGELSAKEAIPQIKELINDNESIWIRQSAATALGKMGAKETIPELIKLLKDNNDSIRTSAANALGDLEAKEAIPAIVKLLADKPDDYNSSGIANALGKLITKGTLSQIVTLAKEANVSKKLIYPLSQGINRLGVEKGIPELIPLLKEEDEGIRSAASGALGKIINLKAIPELIKLLKHENGEVRGFAAIVLVDLYKKDEIPKGVIEDIKLIVKWGGSYESRARAALKELGEVEEKK